MKYYGKIGYGVTAENPAGSGVWTETITERYYYGEVTNTYRRLETTDKVNDDLSITNTISIVADPFAYSNFTDMRYIEWEGHKWKVSSVQVARPRLILTLGGVYNG